MRQTTFGQFDEADDWPAIGRDEWGPTARRPLPEPEASLTADGIGMKARGFSPAVIREEAASNRPEYHRDDADRYREIDDREHRENTDEQPTTPTMNSDDTSDRSGTETPTMQDYRDAHPDYRGEVNGRPAVLKMTPNGTALIPVEEGGD